MSDTDDLISDNESTENKGKGIETLKGSSNEQKLSSRIPGDHSGRPGPNCDNCFKRECLHHVRCYPEPKGNTLKGTMTCESIKREIKESDMITRERIRRLPKVFREVRNCSGGPGLSRRRPEEIYGRPKGVSVT